MNHLRLFAITTSCSMECATMCSIKWLPVFTELLKCVEHIHNRVYDKILKHEPNCLNFIVTNSRNSLLTSNAFTVEYILTKYVIYFHIHSSISHVSVFG